MLLVKTNANFRHQEFKQLFKIPTFWIPLEQKRSFFLKKYKVHVPNEGFQNYILSV